MEHEIGVHERVSTAVVRAVSAVEGCEPSGLRPLGEVIDPAALDALFESNADGTPRVGGRVEFVYGGCRVSVDDGEYLTVQVLDVRRPIEPERRSSWTAGGRR